MIVLLGGSGYVGQAFQAELQRRQLAWVSLSRTSVDYTSPSVLTDYLRAVKPRFLINAAGYTGRPNVDACEVAKTECLAGNALLPGVIRQACETLGVPWGHVSSGCIYTGSRVDGSGFRETDPANFSFRQNNCSFYSGCKALGEELLADAQKCFVWRLRIPFDERDSSRNYISKLLRYSTLLEATNSLSQLTEFVAACVDCWTMQVPFGIYNLTNPGVVTTSEVVSMIQQTGLSAKEFRFFRDDAEFMQLAARAPRSNCVLDSGKAQAAGIRMSSVHDALLRAMKNWVWE